MNNQSYEEYIRSIVGYPMNSTYANNPYERNFSYDNMEYTDDENIIRQCYPKIYRIINPMVQEVCSEHTAPITEDLINQMTNEIYFAIEDNNEVNININLTNSVGSENRAKNENVQNREVTKKEDRQMRPRNPLLQDLIRILLINELLRRRRRRPRPPFPFPGGRPPMRPRSMDFYESNYYNDLYEY